MRTLSTMVLSSSSDPKKKVYPTNYVEPQSRDFGEQDVTPASTYMATYEDEEMDTVTFEALVSQGDEHALQIPAFEQERRFLCIGGSKHHWGSQQLGHCLLGPKTGHCFSWVPRLVIGVVGLHSFSSLD